jgi:hypothetical protein
MSKAGADLAWPDPDEELVNAEGEMIGNMPCILLPQQAASWDNPSAVSRKVMHSCNLSKGQALLYTR